MMKKENGYLVISLDFELLWGIFDGADFSKKEAYFHSTRKVIPEILNLFQKYEIHCTWAIVGMLFQKNWTSWEENKPVKTPTYKDMKLSAYSFGELNKEDLSPEFCFAPELIKEIKETPFQEIGSHTYSHYYCREEGQNLEQFKEDLIQAIRIAKEFDIQLKSLVFPRNQYNEKYLEVCAELGIHSVRSNPDTWYWKKPNSENLLVKLFRTGDAYNPFAKKKSYKLEKNKIFPSAQKASRFLRPFEQNYLLNKLKLRRIKSEMLRAAKNSEVYHLWWHPHNFGNHPKECLRDLEELLSFYKKCKTEYSFKSLTMGELRELMIK